MAKFPDFGEILRSLQMRSHFVVFVLPRTQWKEGVIHYISVYINHKWRILYFLWIFHFIFIMDQHRLWLMTEAQYHSFIGNKTKLYYETYQKDVDDTLLIQYYTHIIIYFLRKRKFSSENPHTAEKLIYTAVALFRRYYLVNPLYS